MMIGSKAHVVVNLIPMVFLAVLGAVKSESTMAPNNRLPAATMIVTSEEIRW